MYTVPPVKGVILLQCIQHLQLHTIKSASTVLPLRLGCATLSFAVLIVFHCATLNCAVLCYACCAMHAVTLTRKHSPEAKHAA